MQRSIIAKKYRTHSNTPSRRFGGLVRTDAGILDVGALNYLTVPVYLASKERVDRKLCASAAVASKSHSKLMA